MQVYPKPLLARMLLSSLLDQEPANRRLIAVNA